MNNRVLVLCEYRPKRMEEVTIIIIIPSNMGGTTIQVRTERQCIFLAALLLAMHDVQVQQVFLIFNYDPMLLILPVFDYLISKRVNKSVIK